MEGEDCTKEVDMLDFWAMDEKDCTKEVDMSDFWAMFGVFKGDFWIMEARFVRGLL